MGGTQPENFLNTLGGGDILKWKRRAEQYLVESGVPYTIVHPGGLLDDAGCQRQLVLDVDDKLLQRKVRVDPLRPRVPHPSVLRRSVIFPVPTSPSSASSA